MRSIAPGIVMHSGWNGEYGYAVKVRHADGSIGLYAHLSRIGVQVGQRVQFGDYLGGVGNTGRSFGNHLHLEVRLPGDQYGRQYDPLRWMQNNAGAGRTGGSRGIAGGPYSLAELKWFAQKAGFSPAQASIMAAIAMGESSGRPDAWNGNAGTGDNSYGLWQINMLGGMGPERRRLFGIQSDNQLLDPMVNARAAFKIYQMQGFGAWSVYTNGSFRQWLTRAQSTRAAAPSGGGGGGGYGGGGMGYLANTARSANEIAGGLGGGYSVAFFRSDPELWGLLQRAAAGGWSDSKLVAEIRDTRWWKLHSESQRNAIMLRETDPATYAQNMRQQRDNIRRTATNLGARLSDEEVENLARLSYMGNWTDGQITTFIVNKSEIERVLSRSSDVGGQAGELQEAFTQWADQYGVRVTDRTIADWVAKVLKGKATPGDYQAILTRQAKALYPHLSDSIDQGMTLVDLAAPFTQTASSVLERNPEDIDIRDRFIRRALRGDGKGMMSMGDFEEMLRRSDEWQTTDNARAAYDTFGREVLQNFGFAW